MNDLYFYLTPDKVTSARLRLDDGLVIMGYGPVGAHGRPNAYHFQIPPSKPSQGATLSVQATGYQPLEQRGLMVANPEGEATFQADDFHLVLLPVETHPPKGELDEGKQEETGTKPPPVG